MDYMPIKEHDHQSFNADLYTHNMDSQYGMNDIILPTNPHTSRCFSTNMDMGCPLINYTPQMDPLIRLV